MRVVFQPAKWGDEANFNKLLAHDERSREVLVVCGVRGLLSLDPRLPPELGNRRRSILCHVVCFRLKENRAWFIASVCFSIAVLREESNVF